MSSVSAYCAFLAVASMVIGGCGSNTSASSSSTGSQSSVQAATTSSVAAGTANVAHLGCSEYCQTAGGYGGDDENTRAMVRLETRDARPLADGTVALTFRCMFPQPCRGTVFFDSVSGTPFSNMDHGSDIDMTGGGTSRTIAVPVPSRALRELRQAGRVPLAVSADLGRSFCPTLSNPKAPDCFSHPTIPLGRWRALELMSWRITLRTP